MRSHFEDVLLACIAFIFVFTQKIVEGSNLDFFSFYYLLVVIINLLEAASALSDG